MTETPHRPGDVEAEHRALREGWAVVDVSWLPRLELAGADRQRLLNGLVTCDVKALEPGSGAYGFFTNPQGRILSDVVVLALEGALWLRLGAGQGEAMRQHLLRYVVAEDVQARPLDGTSEVLVAGPLAARGLAELGMPLPEPRWGHLEATLLGSPVRVVADGSWGLPGFALWAEGDGARLPQGLTEAGAVPARFEALERARVEAGAPRFGVDFGVENFPQETGLEEAVSYTKGCYLGQEIVARIHYRGHVNRRLTWVAFEERPEPGAPLLVEGREVGRATSVAPARPGPGWLVLAILHRRAFEPGATVQLETGGQGRVVPLPG